MIAIAKTPVGDFLEGLRRRLPPPRAIVCISAHWETWFATVTGNPAPGVIYDFTGPRGLHELTYQTPGDPSLAIHVAELLSNEGIETAVDANRGFDHGVWIPLRLIYPEAAVPVVQLSLRSDQDSRYLFAMGRALQPLREDGVLILASGGAVHNRYEIAGRPMAAAPSQFARAFDAWLTAAVTGNRLADLVNWRTTAPDPDRSHPYPAEHFLPLFVALGAGGGGAGRRIHSSFMHGSLSMSAFQWD